MQKISLLFGFPISRIKWGKHITTFGSLSDRGFESSSLRNEKWRQSHARLEPTHESLSILA